SGLGRCGGECDACTRMLDFDGDAPRPCPRCEPTRSAADYADPEHPVIRKQQALDQAAAELAAAAGPALPGTLVVRAYECGKPRCRCHTSPAARHGPYAEWTRKIGGKTATRRPTPHQLPAAPRLL